MEEFIWRTRCSITKQIAEKYFQKYEFSLNYPHFVTLQLQTYVYWNWSSSDRQTHISAPRNMEDWKCINKNVTSVVDIIWVYSL